MSEHNENPAISMKLSDVNLTEKLRNYHRIFRRDRR